jgi:two-component system CheB/CheR fusion protein
MVVLQPVDQPALPAVPTEGNGLPSDDTSKDMLIRQLEEQLRITNEQFLAVSEQLESSQEGFLSANEELMSINEEFQSTNEELETSKEELQALNEELVTVNAELMGKVEELDQANSDMENLLACSGIATIFLDRQLNIKRFTPGMATIFNLIPADIGRPFLHLAGAIDWPTLTHDAEMVLAGQPFAEREITSFKPGCCFLKRVFPYHTLEGVIDGIVISFIDITARKQAETELRSSNEDLTRINRAMVGRELRMIELKQEVNALCERIGEQPRYPRQQ